MSKQLKRILCLVFAIAMIASLMAGCGGGDSATPSASASSTGSDKDAAATPEKEDDSANGEVLSELPREETLYTGGHLFSPLTTLNPVSGNCIWPVTPTAMNSELIYESLFMYNQVTAELEPLLGTEYTWVDDLTLEVKLNPDAKWNDGEALTAEDVAYTYELAQLMSVSWSTIWTYCESIEATDENTVTYKMKADNPNPLLVERSLATDYILPKHVFEAKYEELGETDLRQWENFEPVGSGPYKMYYHDDTRVVCIRDDNYWGQAESMFGKLPAPKYYAHIIYKDNAAANTAFTAGEMDLSDVFMPQIWELWEDKNLPVQTYYKDAPYYQIATLSYLWFNTSVPGLDNIEVRRALAYAFNYPKISEVAISSYGGELIPSLFLDEEREKYVNETEELTALRWTYDVDKANEILDGLGAEKGSDGIRVLPDGTRLGPWKVECPKGWSDWTAALEVACQSAKEVGIELQTDLPEKPQWLNNQQMGDFDIMLASAAQGLDPAQPWSRCQFIMDSRVAPVGEQAFTNYNRFSNERADEIIDAIPGEKDETKLKELYTELEKIYLENIWTIPLFNRSGIWFHTNSTVWTNWQTEDNNSDIPPVPGAAGTRILYEIEPAK